jgi:hypothetical protein
VVTWNIGTSRLRVCSGRTLSKAYRKERCGPDERLLVMNETLPSLFESSFRIAWDYLATGELGNPDTAARHLLDTIETMIRHGERRRLLLANRSIASYQRFRAERGMSLAS